MSSAIYTREKKVLAKSKSSSVIANTWLCMDQCLRNLEYYMLKQCLENVGEGLLQACISSKSLKSTGCPKHNCMPQLYLTNVHVSKWLLAAATNFPTKGLRPKRRRSSIFQVVFLLIRSFLDISTPFQKFDLDIETIGIIIINRNFYNLLVY
jgi:hypothetical protein